jgi:hypothetical protein
VIAMRRALQWALVAVGALTLIALLVAIVQQVVATFHGDTPARVVHVAAVPYPLTVSFYRYPAAAGDALPFAVAPQQPAAGTLTYSAESVPGPGVDATPVRASLSPDPRVPNGAQGTAEITVRGPWTLVIVVRGPLGVGEAEVPISATVPAVLSPPLGWLIALVPVAGMLAFLLALRGQRAPAATGR